MSALSPIAAGSIVLDTNVVSELMRPAPHATVIGWAEKTRPESICTTAVTLAEVRFGIARLPDSRRKTVLSSTADEVFSAFAHRVLSFDADAADAYADIVVEREQAGRPILGFDAQIAAICRSQHLALATRNTDDFTSLGLSLIDPWGRNP